MDISLKVILAPFLGAAFGWLAAKGFPTTADQQATITAACVTAGSGIATVLGHWWHEKTQAKAAGLPPPVVPPRQGGFIHRYLLVWMGLCVMVYSFLSACSTLGFTPPQTLDQKLAYSTGVVTGVLNTIAQATTAGTLSSTAATKANTMALAVQATLTSARQIETASPTEATQDLALASSTLTAVQQYLTAAGVK